MLLIHLLLPFGNFQPVTCPLNHCAFPLFAVTRLGRCLRDIFAVPVIEQFPVVGIFHIAVNILHKQVLVKEFPVADQFVARKNRIACHVIACQRRVLLVQFKCLLVNDFCFV